MARITENYDQHTKDELLAEAQARGIEGVNTGSLKGDIVAALEDNDTSPAQPPKPLPPLVAGKIPQVEDDSENIPRSPEDGPKDEDFTDGIFRNKADGQAYALCIHEPDTYANTHTLKNSRHTWSGTEDQFEKAFSKK